MAKYILRGPNGGYLGVWKIGNGEAIRLGTDASQAGPGSYFKAEEGEDIWGALQRQTPWFEAESLVAFHKTILDPGNYYPRMARPMYRQQDDKLGWCPDASKERNRIAIAKGQMTALIAQLARICQTVHPTPQTFETYGHDIRNLLILACTEIEAHWRAVLEANGLSCKTYNTNHYVKLSPALRLEEYGVRFSEFPWLGPTHPFKGWGNTAGPTKSLTWYSAYNAVKHDRENQFEQATLGNAFNAVSACFIMILAQYGDLSHSFGGSWVERSFFSLSNRPQWSNSDVYIHPFESKEWKSVSFPF